MLADGKLTGAEGLLGAAGTNNGVPANSYLNMLGHGAANKTAAPARGFGTKP